MNTTVNQIKTTLLEAALQRQSTATYWALTVLARLNTMLHITFYLRGDAHD
jgi:hypothetical protein